MATVSQEEPKGKTNYSVAQTDEESATKKELEGTVSIAELFRFATPLDYFLTTLACLCAAVTGYAQDHLIIVWGDSLDVGAATGTTKKELHEENLEIFIAFIILGAASGICAWIYTALFKITGYRQGAFWRKHYLEAVLHQDIAWFDTNDYMELPSKIAAKTAAIEDGVSAKLGEGVMFIAQFLGGFIIGFWKSWDVALVGMIFAPLCTWGIYYLTEVTGEAQRLLTKAYSKAGSVASETINNMRTVFALQCENAKTEEYVSHLESAQKAGEYRARRIGVANGLLFSTGNVMTGFCMLYVVYQNAKLLKEGKSLAENADKFVAMFCVQQGAQSLGGIGPTLKALAEAKSAAFEVLNTITNKPKIDTRVEGKKPEKVSGELEFKEVAFRYPSRKDHPIYKNLNVKIEAGKTVAFVGGSGSGKSTAVQLIERFYDPDQGTVSLDGVDLKELDINWLRKNIGLVSQEPTLYTGTIHDNIARGKPGASRDDVMEAAKKANAHNFIMDLPNNYDTDVGGGGGKLSGGQKQRVAIARAIIKDPAILLLDEATSALDNESERIVQEALDDLLEKHKRTTLVIAHRLTTIRNADKIVVLDEGDVIEEGNHETLMSQKGKYFSLVMAAEAHEKNRKKISMATTSPNAVEANTAALVETKDAGDVELGVMGEERASEGGDKGPSEDEKVGCLTMCKRSLGMDDRPAEVVAAEKAKKQKAKDEAKAQAKEDSDVVSRIWKLFEPDDNHYYRLGLFGSAITGLNNPLIGIIFVKLIRILYETDRGQLLNDGAMWCGIMVASGLANQLACMCQAYGFGMLSARMTTRLRTKAYVATITQDISYYDVTPPGQLTALLDEECRLIPALTGEALGRNIAFAFSIIFSMLFAFGLGSPKIGGLFLAVLPFMMASMAIEFAVIAGKGSGGGESVGSMAATVMSEAVTSIRTVMSFSLEREMLDTFNTALDEHVVKSKPKAIFKGLARFGSQAALMWGFGFIYYIGNMWIINGEITESSNFFYGDMQAYERFLLPIFCMFMLAAAFGQASVDATDMTAAAAAGRKLFKLLDRQPPIPPAIRPDPSLKSLPKADATGEIQFQNIAFTYPSRKEVQIYQDLTVTIEAGKTVAFVGSSGSGKSTAVQLIERFYDPSSGRVLIDGQDYKGLDPFWLRSQIGLVGQEPVLFSGTIGDNIALGKKGATESEMIQAAKMANAHTFIREFPEMYDTDVGPGGNKLSGGQKQRIAIARAIIKDPAILLLDEATSALDNQSERVVQAALDDLLEQRQRTTVVIAHRLSTIRNADKIVVLDHGDLVEQGTHDELIALNGAYAKLASYMQ